MKTSRTTSDPAPVSTDSENIIPGAEASDAEAGAVETSSWPLQTLSQRECEVLRHIGDGKSIRKTAAAMQLSPKTIETYCDRIKRKLGLRSGKELRHLAVLSRVLDRTLLANALAQTTAYRETTPQTIAVAVTIPPPSSISIASKK